MQKISYPVRFHRTVIIQDAVWLLSSVSGSATGTSRSARKTDTWTRRLNLLTKRSGADRIEVWVGLVVPTITEDNSPSKKTEPGQQLDEVFAVHRRPRMYLWPLSSQRSRSAPGSVLAYPVYTHTHRATMGANGYRGARHGCLDRADLPFPHSLPGQRLLMMHKKVCGRLPEKIGGDIPARTAARREPVPL